MDMTMSARCCRHRNSKPSLPPYKKIAGFSIDELNARPPILARRQSSGRMLDRPACPKHAHAVCRRRCCGAASRDRDGPLRTVAPCGPGSCIRIWVSKAGIEYRNKLAVLKRQRVARPDLGNAVRPGKAQSAPPW